MRSCVRSAAYALAIVILARGGRVMAHAGPPYPMVSERVVGSYRMAVWTDPDTTNDGSPGGQFWVIVTPAAGQVLSRETNVTVSIHAPEHPEHQLTTAAVADARAAARYFAALVMDHEGLFNVRVNVVGPLGEATVNAQVQATYDERPSGWAVAVYVLPFLLVGGLWVKVLLRRGA
jgi:hypothetical protein